MDYLALYRKYRPKELDEVVGQEEIKKILASSVLNGTITHAYLFSGPRGTGKTTMAKILAKMVNCESPVDGNACNKCSSCLNILNSNDVIEIDAASNNGVDEIRDLREKANLVPSIAKYKVYIIDEVHMLTTQAFNALLKTLEDPPRHVIFILATTEFYKIPLTITSRCQKFQFNKISVDGIVDRLKKISKDEKIDVSDEALYEIARISDGGMRDSINFLDQLRSFSNKKITVNDVFDVCGNVSSGNIFELFSDIYNNNSENVVSFFENMDSKGKNYGKFFEDVVLFLKDVVLFKRDVNHKYIKSNIEVVKKMSSMYSIDMLFYIIDEVICLMGKLGSVSRQSVIVISNFLLIMTEIDKLREKNTEYENNLAESVKLTVNYDNNANNLTKDVVENENNLVVEQKTNCVINVKNKGIIINNTFAVASKNLKNDLQKKYVIISDYLTDKKFTLIASALIDTILEVAGKNYIILSAKNDMIVNKIYDNYKLCQEFLELILGEKYNFVVINNDEWNNCRDLYISTIRSGKKYELRELEDEELPVIVDKEKETIVDKLFELVGEDSVEFK